MSSSKEYTRYYGGFRGVDFSTDETLVSEKRLPYAVNVYKNYSLGVDQGVETIAGFRKRVTFDSGVDGDTSNAIYGIHHFEDLNEVTHVLIHSGTKLYKWTGYGEFVDEQESDATTLLKSDMNDRDSVSFVFNNRLYILDGKNYLYFDGSEIHRVADDAYIPTTYINIVPGGDNENEGVEYEQRNILQPKFKHTYIADGESTVYKLNEANIDGIDSITVYGKKLSADAYTVNTKKGEVTFTTAPIKPEENERPYPEFYAGVEITAVKEVYDARKITVARGDGSSGTYTAIEGESEEFISIIESATVAAVFDNRIFLSGIKGKPNLIFFCARNNTGHSDPSYIGILNYMEDGVDNAPIKAMLPVANSLLVLKADSHQDGTVYYHAPYETGDDIMPKIYPSESGLAGTGCLGAAINFLDDPVFVSKYGLEAIGQLSVRYERAREHRSTLVDAKLLQSNLNNAKLAVYAGYLYLLVDGKIFMADSRQTFTGNGGTMEYEWFYLEEIGIYKGQYTKYEFLTEFPGVFMEADGATRKTVTLTYNGVKHELKLASDIGYTQEASGEIVTVITGNVMVGETEYEVKAEVVVDTEGKVNLLLVDSTGEMTGGVLSAARCIATIGDTVFFGTEAGDVCCFNFDKRDVNSGVLTSNWYTFDGRTIYSGFAMKMDNCGVPHMTKSTIKKSTVAKVQNFLNPMAKVKVLTNNSPSKDIDRLTANRYLDTLFSSMDFANFSFVAMQNSLFLIREKEKKWVEKQYYIYSDEYQKPFALIYLAYRYKIVGSYKE